MPSEEVACSMREVSAAFSVANFPVTLTISETSADTQLCMLHRSDHARIRWKQINVDTAIRLI